MKMSPADETAPHSVPSKFAESSLADGMLTE